MDTKQVKKTIGTATWSRLCIFFAAPGASGVVKELHAKGEAAFMAEVGAKAQMWWNQSGNSEASKIKVAWAEDKKKKKMRGASSSGLRNQRPSAKQALLRLLLLLLVLLFLLPAAPPCVFKRPPHNSRHTHVTYLRRAHPHGPHLPLASDFNSKL